MVSRMQRSNRRRMGKWEELGRVWHVEGDARRYFLRLRGF